MDSTKNLTVGQVVGLIDNSISQFAKTGKVDRDSMNSITYAVSLDVKLRDYLLGLPAEGYSLEQCKLFLNHILLLANQDEIHPLLTILSAWEFEAGDEYKSHLAEALNLKPDYSLAKLLSRVFTNYDSLEMSNIRKQLHPKVRTDLEGMKDSLISA